MRSSTVMLWAFGLVLMAAAIAPAASQFAVEGEIWAGDLSANGDCPLQCCCPGDHSISQDGVKLAGTVPSGGNPCIFQQADADYPIDVTLATPDAPTWSFDFVGTTYTVTKDGNTITYDDGACTESFSFTPLPPPPAPDLPDNGGRTEAECDGVVETPWLGDFTADAACDTGSCCCVAGGESLFIDQSGTDNLDIQTVVSITGTGCPPGLTQLTIDAQLESFDDFEVSAVVAGSFNYRFVRFPRNDGVQVIFEDDAACNLRVLRQCEDGSLGIYPETAEAIENGETVEETDPTAPPPGADGGSGGGGNTAEDKQAALTIISIDDIPAEDGIMPQLHQKDYCLGIGECGADGRTCYNPRPAELMADVGWDEESLKELFDVCPSLIGIEKTCCNPADFAQLSAVSAQIFFVAGSCLTCVQNLIQPFCKYVCHPDASLWMRAFEVTVEELGDPDGDGIDGKYSLWRTEVYIDPEAGEKFFNGCKDVLYLGGAAPIPVFNLVTFSEGPFGDYLDILMGMGKYNPPIGSPAIYVFNTSDQLPEELELMPIPVMRNCFESGPLMCDQSSCDFSLAEGEVAEAFVCDGTPDGGSSELILAHLNGTFPGSAVDHWDAPTTSVIVAMMVISTLIVTLISAFRVYVVYHSADLEQFRQRTASDQSSPNTPETSKRSLSDSSDSGNRAEEKEEDPESQTSSQGSVDKEGEGAGADHSDHDEHHEYVSTVYKFLHNKLSDLGIWCSYHPYITLTGSAIFIVSCMVGLGNFGIETDPVKLFVKSGSRTKDALDTYAEYFDPFHRLENVIVRRDDGGLALSEEMLDRMFDLLGGMDKIIVEDLNGNDINYRDLCFSPTQSGCVMFSVTQYFQNDINEYRKYLALGPEVPLKHVEYCLNSPLGFDPFVEDAQRDGNCPTEGPTDCPCRADFLSPIDQFNIIFSDYDEDYREAPAFSFVLLLLNDIVVDNRGPALAWERKFIKYMAQWEEDNKDFVQTFYYTETSLNDEIDKESNAAGITVAASYILMFLYVCTGLAYMRRPYQQYLLQSHVMLGVAGLLTVLLATLAGFGLLSFFGIKVSLVVLQVVPFLQLAIGVDNVFLLVSAAREAEKRMPGRADDTDKVAYVVGQALAEIGPSMTLASFSSAAAMTVGTFSPMPAIQAFAIYASVCVTITYFLQITLFPAFLALDMIRGNDGRADFLFCIPNANKNIPACCGARTIPEVPENDEGTFERTKAYDFGIFLTGPAVSSAIVIGYVIFTFAMMLSLPKMIPGLEQTDALPAQSHAVKFLNAFQLYLEVGVPVYFVVGTPYNYSDTAVQSKFCAGVTGCSPTSVGAFFGTLDKQPEKTYIATKSNQWLDDLLVFGEPLGGRSLCCRRDDETDAFIRPPDQDGPENGAEGVDTCLNDEEKNTDCPSRFAGEDNFMGVMHNFMYGLPSEDCAKAGASYADQIYVQDDRFGKTAAPIPNVGKLKVDAASYRMYNVPLSTQEKFINSYKQALAVTEFVSEYHDLDNVFAYAPHHVFFEQYIDIELSVALLIGLGLMAVFLIHIIIYGSVLIPALVVFIIMTVAIDTTALCGLWEVQLNGFSMVNLVITVGISDSISHIALHYLKAKKADPSLTAREAVLESYDELLYPVFFGNIITTILGVAVLGFAKAKIFEKYYFRMYIVMVSVGAFHGLIIVPAVLAWVFWRREHMARDAMLTYTKYV